MERFENGVRDLRSALEFLRKRPGQLVETEVEVDPEAELSGVYRYVGAGGTVMRPTRTNGPAMLFRNLKGFDEASAVIGVLASRERVAALLGCRSADLGRLLCECVAGPVEPLLSEAPAECQQVVHLASEPGFDLRRLLPAPTNTPVDAGPYITLGMCYATHPDTGRSDVTIHRLCIQGRDELSIFLQPGSRHIGAMPEFPGYNGAASSECWLLKVKALTHRRRPILQTCIGPSEEHVNMAGIPTEASILGMLERAMPGRVRNVYAHRAGGGKYMAVLQVCKKAPTDEGRQRQAALLAFSAFPELKHVILVDEDVDIFDTDDVLWALSTRYQGDLDTVFIPGVRCHPLDPSAGPEYSGSIAARGISCKTIFDCTVPYAQKGRFERARFMDTDPARWLPGWEN